MPDIIQISSIEEAQFVTEAAGEDGHYVIGPTHYWNDKAGKIQGYFSNGIIQVSHFWMRSDSTPRDSLEMIQACQLVMKKRIDSEQLVQYATIACQPTSPFYPLIQKHLQAKPIATNLTLFGKSTKNIS